jgi:hypothetical protein
MLPTQTTKETGQRMSGNSLVNLGELSKPATVLIEKVSDAIGGFCKPWQIVRVAKAEAEAEKIQAESQIQISDIQRRAMHRFLIEEGKKQANIEEITVKALPLLSEESTPQDVDDDWITNFFDRSRIISDDKMQQLWASILASEANSPHSFSRRTVNLVADLEKTDAELFNNLCGFIWRIEENIPLIYQVPGAQYDKFGINFKSLSHLESLGLIQFGPSGFSRYELLQKFRVAYFGTEVELAFPKVADNNLSIGRVLLTKAGSELARVCASKPVDGYLNEVIERWQQEGLSPTILINSTENSTQP